MTAFYLSVKGFPKAVVKYYLCSKLKEKLGVSLRVHELKQTEDKKHKQAVIEFVNEKEGMKAYRKLTESPYKLNGKPYELKLKIEPTFHRSYFYNTKTKKKVTKPEHKMPQKPNLMIQGQKDTGKADPTPSGRESEINLSDIDLEAEMLKKQMLIMEEKNRLIMEQKKLDDLKESFYGSAIINTNERVELNKPQKDRKRSRKKPKKGPAVKTRLPEFVMPCRLILGEMESIITEHVKDSEREMLERMIQLELRQRIMMLLGKTILSAPKILALYRQKYPATTDKQFVLRHYDSLKVSFWPQSSGYTAPQKKSFGPGSSSHAAFYEKSDVVYNDTCEGTTAADWVDYPNEMDYEMNDDNLCDWVEDRQPNIEY